MKYFIFQRPHSQFSVSFVQVVPEGRNKTLDISIVHLNAAINNKNLMPMLRELGPSFFYIENFCIKNRNIRIIRNYKLEI